jgi:hypothetical protein
MIRTKRIFVSVPRDHHLDERQKASKRAIFAELIRNDLEPQQRKTSAPS